MSKIVISVWVLSLILFGFVLALFAFSAPVWLPIVLLVLVTMLVALLGYKVVKKSMKERKRKYKATSGGCGCGA